MLFVTAMRSSKFPVELLAELPSPCLVVDLAAAERNVERAVSHVAGSTTKLRPHFKAHKCTTLMKTQLSAGGCAGVTCATAWEAQVLARAGFPDVLVANQVADRRGLASLAIAARTTRLTVCIDDPSHVAILERCAADAGVRFGVLIEVDVGMLRCGVTAGGPELLGLAAAVAKSDFLTFRGLQGYEGHAVLNVSRDARRALVAESAAIIQRERARLEQAGFGCEIRSGGGTGTYDLALEAGALNELQLGSYALMDARYGGLGLPFENALFCCATVLSRQGDRAVIDAGLKSLSAEYGMSRPVPEGMEITVLSDEHAQVVLPPAHPLAIGDRLLVIPAHIDPTMNLHSSVFAFDAECGVETWPVDGRRP
jgi:D-serine deaminase-like pyridoxal phosphate-dependent protein